MQLHEMESISHSSDSSQFFAVIIANPTSGIGGFPLTTSRLIHRGERRCNCMKWRVSLTLRTLHSSLPLSSPILHLESEVFHFRRIALTKHSHFCAIRVGKWNSGTHSQQEMASNWHGKRSNNK